MRFSNRHIILIGFSILLFPLLLFNLDQAEATIFCVSNSNEFSAALFVADDNSQDDTIKMVQGTYVDSFIYSSNEAFHLSIEGGYTSDAKQGRLTQLIQLLDGNNVGPVLVLKQ